MAKIFKRVNGKKVTKIIAKHASVQGALNEIAVERAIAADAILASHKGSGASYIEVDYGDVDRYVVLNDERGQGAAMSIEYGRGPDEDGNGATQGIWALHDAFGLAHGEG